MFEAKGSKNDLHLLAIVWATEQMKNYVSGLLCKLNPDHNARALMSVLIPNGGNNRSQVD